MPMTYRLGPTRRAVNVLMTGMLKCGFGPRASYLLTTTGRRTGQRRTTPVTVVEDADRRWLVAPYGQVGWVRNVRADPVVTLRRGRDSQLLRAQEIDADAAGPVLERYLRAVPVTAPFFDVAVGSPPAAFVAEAHDHPVFTITPERPRPR